MEPPSVTFKLINSSNRVEMVDNVAKSEQEVAQCHKILDLIINNTKQWRIKYDVINLVVRSEEEYKILCKYREYCEWKTAEMCEAVMNSMELNPEDIQYDEPARESVICPQIVQQAEPAQLPKCEYNKPPKQKRKRFFH